MMTPVGGISLEPGGQFELFGRAAWRPSTSTADRAALRISRDCRAIGGPLNIHFLGLGVTPLWSVADIPSACPSRATAS